MGGRGDMKKAIFSAFAVFQDAKDGLEKEKVFKKAFMLERELTTAEQGVIKNEILKELQDISLTKGSSITNTYSSYSFVDKVEKPFFGDCLVQVRLPYCLYLPQNFSYKAVTKNGVKARLVLNKQWTLHAKESSVADLYTEGSSTFFKNSQVITPRYPLALEAGWDPPSNVKNSEKLEDESGVYRYSRISIMLETNVRNEEEIDKELSNFHKKLHGDCLDIVNRFLDIYRYVANRSYIGRLNTLSIDNVYFFSINSGYYPMPLNIGTAEMNLPEEQIEKIHDLAEAGTEPPLHALLALQALGSMKSGANLLAVVESFKALDVFIEEFLYARLSSQGSAVQDFEAKLENAYNTKDRLKDLLKEVTGKTVHEIDNELWSEWLAVYKDRNKSIHARLQPDLKMTEKILDLNQKMIDLISTF